MVSRPFIDVLMLLNILVLLVACAANSQPLGGNTSPAPALSPTVSAGPDAPATSTLSTSIPGVPDQSELQAHITNYLIATLGETNFGGRVFCAYHVLDSAGQDTTTTAYLAVFCGEYYLQDQRLQRGAARSDFVALSLQQRGAELAIVGHQRPQGAGSQYDEEIRRIFPAHLQQAIVRRAHTHALETAAEHAARMYYSIP